MLFVKVVPLHGFPSTIVSDRNKVFMSIFWRELFRLQGTTLLQSTAYNPQTNRQSEIVNKIVETYLRCLIQIQGVPYKEVQWLPWANGDEVFTKGQKPHLLRRYRDVIYPVWWELNKVALGSLCWKKGCWKAIRYWMNCVPISYRLNKDETHGG